MRIRIGSFGLATALSAAFVVAAASSAPALNPVARFATPAGSGTVCSKAAPCDIVEAINNAPTGSDVTIEPGVYGSAATPLDTRLGDATTSDLTIHGAAGKAIPVIYSAANVGISTDNGSTMKNLEMIFSGSQYGVISTNSPLTHVISVATAANSNACEFFPSLSDSVCVATGTGGNAIDLNSSGSSPFTGNYAVRNVTAIATGANGTGVSFGAGKFATLHLAIANSILLGSGADLFAYTQNANATATVAISNSDYKTVKPATGGGTATVTPGAGNINTAPAFVNAASGNYAEAKTSPTVDAGAKFSGADTDVVGNPRYLGSAPDMGAYEYLAKPKLGHLKVTKRTKHGFHATLSVNSEGLKTKLHVVARHGSSKQKSSLTSAASHKRTIEKIVIKHLKPRTKYRVSVTAKNAGGHDHTPKTSVHTK